MNINTETITTMTEANQNFSKVAKVAENNGQAVIFKNNKPKFLLIDVDSNSYFDITDDEKIDSSIENKNIIYVSSILDSQTNNKFSTVYKSDVIIYKIIFHINIFLCIFKKMYHFIL